MFSHLPTIYLFYLIFAFYMVCILTWAPIAPIWRRNYSYVCADYVVAHPPLNQSFDWTGRCLDWSVSILYWLTRLYKQVCVILIEVFEDERMRIKQLFNFLKILPRRKKRFLWDSTIPSSGMLDQCCHLPAIKPT